MELLKKIGVQTDKNALAAGLYDAKGNMLCAWEDCGIELNLTEEATTISDEEFTTASEILENEYPDTVKIVLPDDETIIGSYVFANCYNLVTIDIKNIETISNHAFNNCSSLTTVIGSNIKELGESCFAFCSKLTTVDISKVETLPSVAFSDTSALENLDLSNVKTVNQSAFYSCAAKELDLSNAENIGSGALQCAMAEKVYLDKVKTIQYGAFAWMGNLKAIVYVASPNSVLQ